jgi:hypothetical protein
MLARLELPFCPIKMEADAEQEASASANTTEPGTSFAAETTESELVADMAGPAGDSWNPFDGQEAGPKQGSSPELRSSPLEENVIMSPGSAATNEGKSAEPHGALEAKDSAQEPGGGVLTQSLGNETSAQGTGTGNSIQELNMGNSAQESGINSAPIQSNSPIPSHHVAIPLLHNATPELLHLIDSVIQASEPGALNKLQNALAEDAEPPYAVANEAVDILLAKMGWEDRSNLSHGERAGPQVGGHFCSHLDADTELKDYMIDRLCNATNP